MKKADNKYHHGELSKTLIDAANLLIKQQGIEQLSLRKLADNIGVSRSALYHHFKNKNELLCAIAEQSFIDLMSSNVDMLNTPSSNPNAFKHYIQHYLDYALNNPDLYELMFGSTIWKQNSQTEQLKSTAHQCFAQHVKLIETWQQQALINQQLAPLRVAQVTWGTLHGLAKLIIDGVYADRKNLEQLSDTIFELFVSKGNRAD